MGHPENHRVFLNNENLGQPLKGRVLTLNTKYSLKTGAFISRQKKHLRLIKLLMVKVHIRDMSIMYATSQHDSDEIG